MPVSAIDLYRTPITPLAQARWLLIIEEVGNPLPRPFLFVLTSWTTLIFLSFGFVRPAEYHCHRRSWPYPARFF
jgi:hypothetical protein